MRTNIHLSDPDFADAHWFPTFLGFDSGLLDVDLDSVLDLDHTNGL